MNRHAVLMAIFILINFEYLAVADSIAVTNPGFEDPGGMYFIPMGWTTTWSATGYPSDLSGQLLPVYGNYTAHTESAGSTLSQIISGYLIQPNTVYTLQVLVGGRLDSSSFGFAGSRIELVDATSSQTLASEEWHVSSPGRPNGGWVTSSTSFTTGSIDPPIGNQLEILLTGNIDPGYSQTWFDNVTLNAVAVPELSTLTLLGISIIGLVAFTWRRNDA